MIRPLALVLLACWLSADARAQSGELGRALSASRSGGCKGQSGLAAGLRPAQALDDTARLIAGGARPADAAKAAGYRATRLFAATLSGYATTAAVAKAMAERYCDALRDPALTEMGAHRRDGAWWIVLAAPFTPPPPSAAPAIAQRVLMLTNEARGRGRRCGTRWFGAAPPLAPNALLERAAAAHALDMARNSHFEHEGSDGSGPADRITRVGYRWRSVGENIASGQTTPEQVVREWLGSPVHCATLMKPAYTEMGVAFATARASEAGIYWVQNLARPR